ncbi:MAG: MMPL family transporter [Planctomycetaceae bacterium]|nr:MMPL family transporter [Planctomycetaceae bacterium]
MIANLADTLVAHRRLLAGIAIALGLLAFLPALRLDLDRSIESLYAEDDPLLVDYRESKTLFGGDEFVIVAWDEPKLLTPDGKLNTAAAKRIRELSAKLANVGGVNKASTQDLDRVISNAIAFAKDAATEKFGDNPLLRGIAGRFAIERQHDAIDFSRGILIGRNGKTTAIVLRLRPEEDSPVSREKTLERIRSMAAQHDPPAAVAGEPVQVFDAFEYVEEDGRTLFLFSLLLLGAVLLLLFRSVRWVALPLAVTALAVLWTRGLLAVSGAELSMVSSMLNSLVTIIAVATVTHVAVHFRELRRRHERFEALRLTIGDLAGPVFWTAATTGAGFLSLASSDVMPVRSFGLMTALGAAMVLLATALMVPAGAVANVGWRAREPSAMSGERHPRLAGILAQMTGFARRRGFAIVLVAIGLSVVAAVGLTRLKVETDFSENFRDDSPIVVSLGFIEERLGGAGTWEVNFPAPDRLTNEYLDRVRSLANRLRALEVAGREPLTKTVAVTDGLDLLPAGMTTDDPNQDLVQIAKLQPEFLPSLYNPNEGRMRIVLRAMERQSAESKRAIIEKVQATAREEFPEAKTTGLFVLLTYLIESLLRDQVVSFSLAGSALFVMMFVAFRRPWLALVALVPNVLPILLLLGGMGLAGVPVNIGTAMIASVSVGLTIDSSIHYLSGYRSARERGRSVAEALDETGRRVGVAIVFATLALSVGFSVLAASHFVPLIYFGVLVSLAMIGGLLGNLLLLPAFIPWVDRDG